MDDLRRADPKRLLLSQVLDGMRTLFGDSWQAVGSFCDAVQDTQRPELMGVRSLRHERQPHAGGQARSGVPAPVRAPPRLPYRPSGSSSTKPPTLFWRRDLRPIDDPCTASLKILAFP